MRVRPWPLVILAIFQILSPILSLLMSAWAYHTSPAQVIYWLFQRPPLDIFEFCALIPIAGIAIYSVKAWSYPVFFIAMIWSFRAKMRHFDYATGSVDSLAVFLVYAAQVVLALYFLLPPVWRTYFDPSVRWWETLPRYRIDAPGILISGSHSRDCKVIDVSEGGAKVQCASALSIHEELDLSLPLFAKIFRTRVRVLHRLDLPGEGVSFGLCFVPGAEGSAEFRSLARSLGKMDFPERGEGKRSFFQGMGEWLLILLRTGKGLLPEPKYRRKT